MRADRLFAIQAGQAVGIKDTLTRVSEPFYLSYQQERTSFSLHACRQSEVVTHMGKDVHAVLPARSPKTLGDVSFCQDYACDYAYYAGAMANGIASVEMVSTLAKRNILSFFGAGGLSLMQIRQAIDALQKLGDKPYGFNLIHSPQNPDLEEATVALYLEKKVRLVEAAAFLGLSLPLLHYRFAGIHRNMNGDIVAPNRVIAKVSRIEVARHFYAVPPKNMLDKLVQKGWLTVEQAVLAAQLPVCQDITAEADSGGHTDNRPALTLFPTLDALRLQMQAHYPNIRLRLGLAGGIATPTAAAAAFAMGAAYIVTGTVNQACVESGTSDDVRNMLAEATQADVTMAPAADMFEMGVDVQVLKRGTMFAMRARQLYDLYRQYPSIDAIPLVQRQRLEKQVFRMSLAEVWQRTEAFFQQRDLQQLIKAKESPKHKMALMMRSYLGQASLWARDGHVDRKVDYQIWCGSAMGAFNEWARGSFLERWQERTVVCIALNLLYGAARALRVNDLRVHGYTGLLAISPQTITELEVPVDAT
ncbi:MAG: PfaD family polyunsaturated fatty acid/polyketide biosynthesis protein [Mariprofundaceae bacterium]|nr:PfaD family polyunsaturated fatty acid/polyketide biosynthesis protein [Mariprofundaceae bacterium]